MHLADTFQIKATKPYSDSMHFNDTFSAIPTILHQFKRLGIRHIMGGIGKPTTQGKIERWFRTYDLEHGRFKLHRKFEYYNYKRPHMSLNYKTPAEVYFGSVPHVLG